MFWEINTEIVTSVTKVDNGKLYLYIVCIHRIHVEIRYTSRVWQRYKINYTLSLQVNNVPIK